MGSEQKSKEYKNKKWDQEVQKKLRISKKSGLKTAQGNVHQWNCATNKTNHKLNSELSSNQSKEENMMKIQDTKPII